MQSSNTNFRWWIGDAWLSLWTQKSVDYLISNDRRMLPDSKPQGGWIIPPNALSGESMRLWPIRSHDYDWKDGVKMAKQVTLILPDDVLDTLIYLKVDLGSETMSGIVALGIMMLRWVVDCRKDGFEVIATKTEEEFITTKTCPLKRVIPWKV